SAWVVEITHSSAAVSCLTAHSRKSVSGSAISTVWPFAMCAKHHLITESRAHARRDHGTVWAPSREMAIYSRAEIDHRNGEARSWSAVASVSATARSE